MGVRASHPRKRWLYLSLLGWWNVDLISTPKAERTTAVEELGLGSSTSLFFSPHFVLFAFLGTQLHTRVPLDSFVNAFGRSWSFFFLTPFSH